VAQPALVDPDSGSSLVTRWAARTCTPLVHITNASIIASIIDSIIDSIIASTWWSGWCAHYPEVSLLYSGRHESMGKEDELLTTLAHIRSITLPCDAEAKATFE
jgi:hypothetical protein